MAAAEILALVALLFGGGMGVRALVSWLHRADAHDVERLRRDHQMRTDLRDALRSGDHRRLDDFLVMWGSEIDAPTLKHLEQRRDELYIEADARKP
jgi:hypothetical protein